MKALLIFVLLASSCGKEIKAVEGNNPETKSESDISASTKKVLRKIGRKSMDETCKLTEDKAKCEKEKLEHQRANLEDERDTERRRQKKLSKKEKALEEKEKEQAKNKVDEDRTP